MSKYTCKSYITSSIADLIQDKELRKVTISSNKKLGKMSGLIWHNTTQMQSSHG